MSKTVSVVCELGTAQSFEIPMHQTPEGYSGGSLNVSKITSNALGMNGAFFALLEDEWIDLFVIHGLTWKPFKTTFFSGAKLKINYTGHIHPGWTAGAMFRLVITLE